MRVAFVCLGNICRSPMAEAVTRSLLDGAALGASVTVESFGTAGYHVGEGADARADAALARRGWPSGSHRARKLTRADLGRLDLVLCADRANLSDVRRLVPAGVQRPEIRLLAGDRDVPDPWSGTDDGFDRCLETIEAACRGLVAELASRPD